MQDHIETSAQMELDQRMAQEEREHQQDLGRLVHRELSKLMERFLINQTL